MSWSAGHAPVASSSEAAAEAVKLVESSAPSTWIRRFKPHHPAISKRPEGAT